MSFGNRLVRFTDRLAAWLRWEAGLISGEARADRQHNPRSVPPTGMLVLIAFLYQAVSGGLLLLYYQPSVYPTLTSCGQPLGSLSSAPAAWCSTYYILHSVPMGGVLLSSHLYGAYALVALLFVHLFRGLYVGAYKLPGGKVGWYAGMLLLLATLGMGFTGYLLAYTQLSYNATEVSITLLQALPGIGPPLAALVLGDGTPQGMLSRMFALHVVLLPGAIVVLVFLHKRTTLFPSAFVRGAKWGLLYVGVLLAVASAWLWSLPSYSGASGGTPAVTTPLWFFLWVFKLVDFVGVSPADVMILVTILVILLLLVPFLDRGRFGRLRDRPVWLVVGNSLVGLFVVMTAWGDLEPGVSASPSSVLVRLAPILALNAVVVACFHYRYRTVPRDVESLTLPELPGSPEASPASPPQRAATIGPKSERSGRSPSPTEVTLLGLVAALFLVPFGLVVPCLFVAAAFLCELAELASGRAASLEAFPRDSANRWTFPVAGCVTVVGVIVALACWVAL